MRILVAEDTAFWRMQIGEVLEGLGHEVLWASDGAEAWARLAENDEVDLLVTDWEMPRMSGIDLCRRLRAESRETYLPIILLTSREGKKDLAQGLNAGADAFVTKPVNDAELKAQLGVAERILKLEADLATKVRDLTAATRRIDRDQRAAAAVQRSLLPGRAPEIPGVDFGWVYESCELVGGDMFNLCRLTDELVGMYILDVSGHGTPAALLSVGLSHVLTPFPEQGGILKRRPDSGSRDGVIPPSEVAAELNRRYPL
ncbi:MAG: response regulator, partial [Myxococcota bacterium]